MHTNDVVNHYKMGHGWKVFLQRSGKRKLHQRCQMEWPSLNVSFNVNNNKNHPVLRLPQKSVSVWMNWKLLLFTISNVMYISLNWRNILHFFIWFSQLCYVIYYIYSTLELARYNVFMPNTATRTICWYRQQSDTFFSHPASHGLSFMRR